MKVGLIDVDGHNFPSLPLMKISAWHKARGDSVEWYEPLFSGHLDRVYLSKVFSFTADYQYYIDADEVIRGGSGYAIQNINGIETYDKTKDIDLPEEIEHIYPDYSIYGEMTRDTAYGFLSRGCPRGCKFCHVKTKEGGRSYKVADLNEFWRDQKEIKLLDPNILACTEALDLLQQLADSGARIDITQGLDARLLTPEKIEVIKKIKIKMIHFAWDRPQDEKYIVPKLKAFKEATGIRERDLTVYVLTNFGSSLEEDLHRVNNRTIWYKDPNAKFEDYKRR